MKCPECGRNHRVQNSARICYTNATFAANHYIVRYLGGLPPESEVNKVEDAKKGQLILLPTLINSNCHNPGEK